MLTDNFFLFLFIYLFIYEFLSHMLFALVIFGTPHSLVLVVIVVILIPEYILLA